jgi:hypothetical protein
LTWTITAYIETPFVVGRGRRGIRGQFLRALTQRRPVRVTFHDRGHDAQDRHLGLSYRGSDLFEWYGVSHLLVVGVQLSDATLPPIVGTIDLGPRTSRHGEPFVSHDP